MSLGAAHLSFGCGNPARAIGQGRPIVMKLDVFGGLRPVKEAMALRDVLAGVVLASMNIPQVLGYTRIAATPTITGLYTVLLPVVAFSVFGSSRHLVVAAARAGDEPAELLDGVGAGLGELAVDLAGAHELGQRRIHRLHAV